MPENGMKILKVFVDNLTPKLKGDDILTEATIMEIFNFILNMYFCSEEQMPAVATTDEAANLKGNDTHVNDRRQWLIQACFSENIGKRKGLGRLFLDYKFAATDGKAKEKLHREQPRKCVCAKQEIFSEDIAGGKVSRAEESVDSQNRKAKDLVNNAEAGEVIVGQQQANENQGALSPEVETELEIDQETVFEAAKKGEEKKKNTNKRFGIWKNHSFDPFFDKPSDKWYASSKFEELLKRIARRNGKKKIEFMRKASRFMEFTDAQYDKYQPMLETMTISQMPFISRGIAEGASIEEIRSRIYGIGDEPYEAIMDSVLRGKQEQKECLDGSQVKVEREYRGWPGFRTFNKRDIEIIDGVKYRVKKYKKTAKKYAKKQWSNVKYQAGKMKNQIEELILDKVKGLLNKMF